MNKEQVKLQYKEILLAIVAVVMMVGFVVASGGCSTIEGLAKDVSSMSAATRDAMTK